MDWIITLIGIALILSLVGIGLSLRHRRDPELIRLVGAVDAVVKQGAAAQATMRDQERALTSALDQRFAAIAQTLTDTLGSSATETNKTIADVRERLGKIDEAQKNLTLLSTRIVGLEEILSNKQARGAFGEIQLESIVQDILPPSAYQLQATLSNGKRADCLIRLPKPPGSICVDAKFPLESYRALQGVPDDARQAALRAFGAAVFQHVRDIAERYIIQDETAEGALMFVPSEAVYAELHANCSDVVEKANRLKVYIVSPTTLWAVMHTVRAVLKDVQMREQAGIIQKEVGLLLDDVHRLDERVGNLQSHFSQADKDVREIRISTEKIIKRGEKIGDVEIEVDVAAAALTPPKI